MAELRGNFGFPILPSDSSNQQGFVTYTQYPQEPTEKLAIGPCLALAARRVEPSTRFSLQNPDFAEREPGRSAPEPVRCLYRAITRYQYSVVDHRHRTAMTAGTGRQMQLIEATYKNDFLQPKVLQQASVPRPHGPRGRWNLGKSRI
jgi:hypothetical protein